MAFRMIHVVVLSAAMTIPSAADKQAEVELTQLEEEIRENLAQIRALEAQQQHIQRLDAHRRLRDDTRPPSIYGATSSTRPYTSAESVDGAMTHLWLLLNGFLVMFMQAGFAMLEAGVCRRKFVQNILLKNLTDVCVGTLGWWAFGWSFAYSGPKVNEGGTLYLENKFIGSTQFLGHHFAVSMEDGQIEPSSDTVNWFFQWAFASAAATIVSGGVAERMKFPGYCIYSLLLTSFIYPVVVAWTWGMGFLAAAGSVGYMDFAGSGIVHLTGGVGALVGSIIAGPRNNRFKSPRGDFEPVLEEPDEFAPHNETLIELGTAILFFGWYGFNMGSTLDMSLTSDSAFKAAHIAMTTTLSAVVGGLSCFLLRCLISKKQEVPAFCNGLLAGLVSITAGCSTVSNGSSIVIGLVGAIIYQAASSVLKLLKIDDPLDAFPIHGACGAWGVMAAAIFDWGHSFEYVHGWSGFECMRDSNGQCLEGVGGELVGINLAEIVCITLWVGVLSALIFAPLKALGWLVATPEEQELGFDEAKHSPPKAYDWGREEANVPTNNR
mmetsp:Transcript_166261/g.403935  ORF Transcript_166261/g.403935 Transcript_166261/m.403935 type:complete len:550 (-) Transcript_166261:201-1850(-)